MSKKTKALTVVKTAEERAAEIMSRIKIIERDGKFWTDSLSVSEVFGKRHDDLLRAIRKIDEENQAVGLRSFAESSYVNQQGKVQPCFEMTETGFFALVARFNDQKDTDIALIRALYMKEFDRLKTERLALKNALPTREEIAEIIVSNANNLKILTRILERQDSKLIAIESGHNKTDKRVEDIAVKQEQMADELSYVKSKIDHALKGGKFSAPVIAQHEDMILRRFSGNCPCCGNIQVVGNTGKMIEDVAEKEHFYGPTQNKLDQTWITCKQCNRNKAAGKLSMDFINKKFHAYQADIQMDKLHKEKMRVEREKNKPKQSSLFEFLKPCNT